MRFEGKLTRSSKQLNDITISTDGEIPSSFGFASNKSSFKSLKDNLKIHGRTQSILLVVVVVKEGTK